MRELWIIDPEARTIRVYRPKENSQQPVAIHREGDHIQCALFPNLRIDAAELFAK